MLISAVRPRWSIKYAFISAIGFCVVYFFIFNMPVFSSDLPAYSGPYEVGVVDIEAPCEKRNLANAVFKDTGKPAFELDTVLFSLYYPAVDQWTGSKAPHPWVSNIEHHAEGYARFAHVNNFIVKTIFSWAMWTLVGSTTIPAHVDAPLRGTRKAYRDVETEQPLDQSGLPKFPVLVFSHGMASSRTSYTQFCGEMASRGYIVAAIEHRDGSGPGTEIYQKDGSKRDLFTISNSDLEPQPLEPNLKMMQLAMRQAEVEETVRVLKQMNDGHGADVHKQNMRGEGEYLPEWRDRLDMSRFIVGGHSYGATLALQALKGAPSEKLPFIGGLILDPGKHSGPLNDDIEVPIVVIHSQSWSAKMSIFQGRPHFDVVKDLVRKVLRRGEKKSKPQYAWFLTSKGTTHPSVTDAPLIEPTLLSWTTGSTIDAREGVLQYVKVGEEFMQYLEDGRRIGVLAEDITHPSYDRDTRSEERRNSMSRVISKYWQIHVSPSTDCDSADGCGIVKEDRDGHLLKS